MSLWKRLRTTSHSAVNNNNASGLLPKMASNSQRALDSAHPAVAAPSSSLPVVASFDSSHLIDAGVVIFHVASSRVVLCYHSVDQYWFLPKGRRDASEDSGAGAEREGFEEVTTMSSPIIRGSNSLSSLVTATGFYPSLPVTANPVLTARLSPHLRLIPRSPSGLN